MAVTAAVLAAGLATPAAAVAAGANPVSTTAHAAGHWAVGSLLPFPSATILQNLTLHYNGKSWTRVKSPDAGREGNQLYGVAAAAGRDRMGARHLCPSLRPHRPRAHHALERWVTSARGYDATVVANGSLSVSS
jgi:hypothetical protein